MRRDHQPGNLHAAVRAPGCLIALLVILPHACALDRPGVALESPVDSGPEDSNSEPDADTGPFPYPPSNFDPTALPLPEGDILLDCGESVFDTTTMEFINWCNNDPLPMIAESLDGGSVVLAMNGFTIEVDATLRLVGERPVILAVHDSATIRGIIDASADHDIPGAGGSQHPACSKGGNGGIGAIANEAGSGGGGGGFGTAGASGGSTASGAVPGPAGMLNGSNALVPLRGGCAGGQGGQDGGAGGAGGGGVQISVVNQLTLSGSIAANGGGGVGGDQHDGGGGGGSGGGILLEAGAVTLEMDAAITANGGGGGQGGESDENGPGASGENGAIAEAGAGGGADDGNGGRGGTGGSVEEIPTPGLNGGATSGVIGASSLLGGSEDAGGGGGGGAVGRAHIHAHARCEARGNQVLSPVPTTSGDNGCQ